FPTDLYIAQGILNSINSTYQLKIVDTRNCSDPTQLILDNIDDSTAIVMLTHIGYDTGYAYKIKSLTQKTHELNCISIWDFSHSIGAVDIDLEDLNIDFAVGSTYKYLNGGPGAPAFLYIHPKHQNIQPTISGWMGQDNPFEFDLTYKPDTGIRKFRVGTPHILSLAALDAALSLFEGIDMREVENTAQTLLDKFIELIEETCPTMKILSPKDKAIRGTQLVIEPHAKDVSAYAIMQNLIDRNIIGDFRQPNSCRFGITPLYISEIDIDRTVAILADILHNKSWNQEKYLKKSLVT
ncbi:MAG: kynureninase, partial [Saprospiraceae bacterium]